MPPSEWEARLEVSPWFTKALKAADLSADLSLHDLRHFFASLVIRQGADVKLVQSRLGHAPAQTTLDVYGHLWPDHDDRTRSMVDEVFAGVEAAYTTRSS